MKPIAIVDFETHKILPRYTGAYPPKPVGVAVMTEDRLLQPQYISWGHPSANNSTKSNAERVLKKLWRDYRVVFHHAMFDCEVAYKHFGLSPVPSEYEDTLFLAYIHDPRARELALKPLAEAVLGIKPRERDQLADWIVNNVPNATTSTWGEFIAWAPGELVSKYAVGDITRTYKLWKKLHAELRDRDKKYGVEEGQQSYIDAYNRELALMPVLMEMESRGIHVDIHRLSRDVGEWHARIAEYDKQIIRRLGGAKAVAQFAKGDDGFNIGSGSQLANALDAAGKVTHWVKTAKGNRSVARKALEEVCNDKKLVELLQRRELLTKYCDTYGDKWLTENRNSFVYPRIHQTRNDESDNGIKGARTGRLSYSDSWQAIPKPDRVPFDDFPVLRDYVIPDERGHYYGIRDYSQQEFRILAHYEAGGLQERYKQNPYIDMHQSALEMINELTGLGLDPVRDRRPVKDIGFGLIYGMGIAKTALKTGQDVETTKQLRRAYLEAIPGFKELNDEIKRRCQRGEPIRTWGGRLYWVEPPMVINGQRRTFEYKMLNVLIQGSAAECTKEAMIRARAAMPSDTRLVLQVHDELVINAVSKPALDAGMKILREAMESVVFDVLMLSDGKWSRRSWGVAQDYNDRR